MTIILSNIGKKFNNRWIFKGITYQFGPNQRYTVLGSNGSGKSTFLQLIAGYRIPSQGLIQFIESGRACSQEELYKFVSIAAPYMELIEELTLREHIDFHFRFKAIQPDLSTAELPWKLNLEKEIDKPVRYFSSGMKQRLRLGLAFFSQTPILLLDEPLSNLDQAGTAWYRELLDKQTKGRTVIICSNQKAEEYVPCQHYLRISDYLST